MIEPNSIRHFVIVEVFYDLAINIFYENGLKLLVRSVVGVIIRLNSY